MSYHATRIIERNPCDGLLFVAACCIIQSMYDGGFSTVPADLADLFGTQKRTPPLLVAAACAAVGLPLAWGIYRTLMSVANFF